MADLSGQFKTSAAAFAAGVILCLIYDVFRTVRLIKRPTKILNFVQDIIYAIIAALVTFIMQLSLENGEIRWFILLFEGLGFIFCRKTLSRPLIFILTKIIKAIKRMYKFAQKTFIVPIQKFTVCKYRKTKIKIKKTRAKVSFSLKKRLQKAFGVLYNKENRKKTKEVKIVETTKQLL